MGFIYVRGRLVNDDDALFGMTPLVYGPFHRLYAKIYADDLDAGLKASRETIEDSTQRNNFRVVLSTTLASSRSRRVLLGRAAGGGARGEGDGRVADRATDLQGELGQHLATGAGEIARR